MKDFRKCTPTRWGYILRERSAIPAGSSPIIVITNLCNGPLCTTHALSMASALEDGYYIKL